MPDSYSPVGRAGGDNASSVQPTSPTGLTDDQVRRWAELIATGESEFPAELTGTDRQRLLDETRRLLRQRLMQLVAHAVAKAIHERQSPRDTEVPP